MMGSYRRIDQIAAQPSKARKRAVLVRPGEAAVTHDISNQDRRDFPRFRHGQRPQAKCRITRKRVGHTASVDRGG
jgi:hypothetical protein